MTTISAHSTAVIRSVPDSFVRALSREARRELDVSRARRQHAAYRHELAEAGYRIIDLPADEGCPDCVFVEDTAVLTGSVAVVARPGAASRRAETRPVAEVLGEFFPLRAIDEPGTLDGGDVLTVADTLFVGRSGRTNAEGIEQLTAIAGEQGMRVIPVDVLDTLHLKSAVTPLGGDSVLVTRGGVDDAVLSGLQMLCEDPAERYHASTLPLRDGRVLVTASAPRTAAMLSRHGYEVVAIDASELQAADGGLTCLSILF